MSKQLPKIGTRSAMSPGNAGESATRKITRRVPNGSPGMEGPTEVRYEVMSFTRGGDTQVYAVR